MEGKEPLELTRNEKYNSTMATHFERDPENEHFEEEDCGNFSEQLTFRGALHKREDEVILNVSQKKFDKPKDQLFLDFFSIYAKSYIEERKPAK